MDAGWWDQWALWHSSRQTLAAVRDTRMALAVNGERFLRVNAGIEDLLALRPDPCEGVRAGGDGAPAGGVARGLRAGFGVACSPTDQPRALQGAWSQVVKPDTRRALLLRVHARGDFNPKSALWTAWREGLQTHCRVSYWDVWDPHLAVGHKRFVVWVGD